MGSMSPKRANSLLCLISLHIRYVVISTDLCSDSIDHVRRFVWDVI